MAPKKRKEESEDSGSEGAAPPSKKAKTPRAPKKPKITEPTLNEMGWLITPPSLISKSLDNPEPSHKICGIDLDGTLVNTKGNSAFASGPNDWKWYNKKVVEKVRELHGQGYKIVIFTNQGSIKGALDGKQAGKQQERCENVVAELGVPACVLIATAGNAAPGAEPDACRKPATGMWEHHAKHLNGGVDLDLQQCMFIGDAAGRELDHSDCDKKFAETIGIQFQVPEDVFGKMDGKRAVPSGNDAPTPPPGGAGGADAGGGSQGEPLNPELVGMFKAVAAHYNQLRAVDKHAVFKVTAAHNAAKAMASCTWKVALENFNKCGKLGGIGKGSLEKIKDFLETGTVSELSGGSGGPDLLAGLGALAKGKLPATGNGDKRSPATGDKRSPAEGAGTRRDDKSMALAFM